MGSSEGRILLDGGAFFEIAEHTIGAGHNAIAGFDAAGDFDVGGAGDTGIDLDEGVAVFSATLLTTKTPCTCWDCCCERWRQRRWR